MTHRLRWPLITTLCVGAMVACLSAPAAAAPERVDGAFRREATLHALGVDQVRDQSIDCLIALGADQDAIAEARRLCEAAHESADMLDLAAQCMALADERAQALVEQCSRPRSGLRLADHAWLLDERLPAFARDNLRLYYGRWLAQERLYDEALEQLDGLDARSVVDPAALLFYQAVVYHQLLKLDEALTALVRLSDDVSEPPKRYAALAALMRSDLEQLSDNPLAQAAKRDETIRRLDHIARRMGDVRRRLDLGRAGKTVRTIEDGVVKSLDELIKELEEQQQQSSSSASSAMRPSQPMQDSRIAEGRGAGQSDAKSFESKESWGDLPAKDREEAMQQIGKDFPAHYRDAIEQYFRSLANEEQE